MNKFMNFLHSAWGRLSFGLVFAAFGFFVSIPIQNSQNSAIQDLLDTFARNIVIDPQAMTDINKIISKLNAPFSWQALMFTVLFFFFGEIVIDMISGKKKIEYSSSFGTSNDGIIVDLLAHLKNECYGRCSNTSQHCSGCEKFSNECDGLLRRYLYKESDHLQESIKDMRNGKYNLDTNIEEYHTIAINHLISSNSVRYSVIQWIRPDEYTDDNKYEETYDRLDFHFLHRLLVALTKKIDDDGNPTVPYYMRDISYAKKNTKFKIQWIFIGDKKCMKANFDYIFRVVDDLKLRDVITDFFEFRIISTSDYQTHSEDLIMSYDGLCKQLLPLSNQPSFGLFGSRFMFADSLDANRHGTIYTKDYKYDNTSDASLDNMQRFFSAILSYTKMLDTDELYESYDKIIQDDPTWLDKTNSIWRPRVNA